MLDAGEINAQKIADENLRLTAALAKARSDNVAKDHFFAVLSHELRTLMTPVLAALSSPETTHGIPIRLLPILEMIHRNVEQETLLIDDLLDITRITHQKLDLRKQSLDLHETLREITAAFETEFRRGKLALELDLQARQAVISADPTRLQQIFANLLKNAIRATPAGGRITVRSRNTAAEKITISVMDTGSGIDPKNLAQLFEPFQQASPPSPRASGLGLGLSIARGLALAHGGRLDGFSPGPGPGKGATFEVTLGTIDGDSSMSGARAASDARAASSSAEISPSSMPLRILLVEDHGDTSEIMAHLLRDQGHDVVVANNVHEALMLASDHFDIVISDLGLPDGSGFEVMRALAAQQPIRGIALSGYATEEDIRMSRDAGFEKHLAKPVALSVLLSAIENISKDMPE